MRLLLLIDSNLQVEFGGFLSRLAHVTNPQSVSHRQSLTYNNLACLFNVIINKNKIGKVYRAGICLAYAKTIHHIYRSLYFIIAYAPHITYNFLFIKYFKFYKINFFGIYMHCIYKNLMGLKVEQ